MYGDAMRKYRLEQRYTVEEAARLLGVSKQTLSSYEKGLIKKPGLITIEFLKPIPPGLSKKEFMVRLEHDIETASLRLYKEGQSHVETE